MMDFSELIQEAISTLTVNKLRTGLAVLGIIIGIGSVIALLSLGQSSQASVANQIESLGANLLTIIPGSQRGTFIQGGQGSATTLTLADANAIATSPSVTDVNLVSPEYQKRAQVTAGGNNTNVTIIGVEPVYATVHNISMSMGTFISSQDVNSDSRVAVIGPTVASNLFPNNPNPVGQSIRISGQAFKVIGVTVSKGGGLGSVDSAIVVPLSTAQEILFGVTNFSLSSISVQAKSSNVMTDAENQIGYLLLGRHNIADPSQADFTILSQSDILGAVTQVTGTFTALLSGIAAISLLVGGIGIMNIMLVTVTERTREIGLRKALGAKKKAIIYQFLVEAIILTFTGGIAGMFFGVIISLIISRVIGLPFTIAPGSVILAIVVSGAIGILFGWYPAKKASDLQPIEALRYE
jgi:putative ABC transport system permease protein